MSPLSAQRLLAWLPTTVANIRGTGTDDRGTQEAAQGQVPEQTAADPAAACRLWTLVARDGGACPSSPVGRPVGRGFAQASEEVAGLASSPVRGTVSGAGPGGRGGGWIRSAGVQSHIISAVGPCFFSNCSDAQTQGNPNNQRIRSPWIRKLRCRIRQGRVPTGTRLALRAPVGYASGLPTILSRAKGCFSAGGGDAVRTVAAADDTAGADGEMERGGQLAGASPRTPGVFSGRGESIDRQGAGAGAGQVPGTRGILCR